MRFLFARGSGVRFDPSWYRSLYHLISKYTVNEDNRIRLHGPVRFLSGRNGISGSCKVPPSVYYRKSPFSSIVHSTELSMIEEAVLCYKKALGLGPDENVAIPSSYVVPHNGYEYPEHLWGFPLGKKVDPTKSGIEQPESTDSTPHGPEYRSFPSILEALRCYRVLHPAASKIPFTFEVPAASSDFPEHLWGLKLGQAMSRMIYRRAFLKYHDQVKALGFSLTTKSQNQEFERTMEALRWYKATHPTESHVPPSFIVPEESTDFPKHLWGLKLGEKVNQIIRDGSLFFRHHDEMKASGLEDQQFTLILLTLRCYRTLHPKARRVPSYFVVPQGSPDYPERVWGTKLGQIMSAIIRRRSYKEHRNQIAELGFTMKLSTDEEQAENALEALWCYRTVHPTAIRIPQPFVVPRKSTDYPEHLWGLKLGQIMSHMISHGSYREHHDEVKALGFSLTTGYRDELLDKILDALRCYRALHPTARRVPQVFVVPHNSSDFPEHVWGMKLGKLVQSMITQGTYEDHHEEVEELGFVLEKTRQQESWANILLALRCYRALHPQATSVPARYVVPLNSTTFPERVWGMKLGQIMSAMVYRGQYRDHRDKVEELGFVVPNITNSVAFEAVREALRYYRTLQPTAARIPSTYAVPRGTSSFPEHLWGMKLGKILHGMLQHNDYPEHHEEVKALGFTLTKRTEEQFTYVLEAMRCYRVLYPNAQRVTAYYVVPQDSTDYPEYLWGMKLGQIMSTMISHGSYREHRDEIEALGYSLKKKSPRTRRKSGSAVSTETQAGGRKVAMASRGAFFVYSPHQNSLESTT